MFLHVGKFFYYVNYVSPSFSFVSLRVLGFAVAYLSKERPKEKGVEGKAAPGEGC